jgi:hypothetical protein
MAVDYFQLHRPSGRASSSSSDGMESMFGSFSHSFDEFTIGQQPQQPQQQWRPAPGFVPAMHMGYVPGGVLYSGVPMPLAAGGGAASSAAYWGQGRAASGGGGNSPMPPTHQLTGLEALGEVTSTAKKSF